MRNLINKLRPYKVGILLAVLAVANLLIFKHLFGFHVNNDTESFVYLINFFKGNVSASPWEARYLNPFYAVVGSKILFFLPAAQSLILTNIFFYFGLVFFTYDLIKRVFKNQFPAFVSAVTVMTGYAMLRYSLTQVQDIGGYFWFLSTIYMGWRWWESKDWRWLLVGSVAVSFGVLTKESGCLGALFVGALFLFAKISWGERLKNFMLFSIFPASTIVINAIRSHDIKYNSIRWFTDNWSTYAPEFYTFEKWLGIHLSTYNILWVFIIFGAWQLVKKWSTINNDIKIYFVAVFLPSMSYYMWPLFIARTVFISAWFFVPIAAYGIYSIYQRGGNMRYIACACVAVVVVTPYVLQITLRYAHLFQIINDCHKNIVCSWNYFWEHRSEFSKIQ